MRADRPWDCRITMCLTFSGNLCCMEGTLGREKQCRKVDSHQDQAEDWQNHSAYSRTDLPSFSWHRGGLNLPGRQETEPLKQGAVRGLRLPVLCMPPGEVASAERG